MTFEQIFEFSGETKNMYTFSQIDDPEKRPVMYPQKIYLSKDLFKGKKKPKSIVLKIEEG